MAKILTELAKKVKNCKKCSLWKSRTQTVFGKGNTKADLMLVGEAPGYFEDKKGQPFVGPAGKLLDKLLASINLKRQSIYITNVLKSRPLKNRDPLPQEIEACKPYLLEQIRIIGPKVIVTLGAFATKVFFKKNVSIGEVHGQAFPLKNYYLFPIYHPAAALHSPNNLATLEKDFLALKEFLKKKMKYKLVSHSPKETQKLGARLAPFLGSGDILSLTGDLGAGKTCFIQGLAKGLGIKARVTSPTFTLIKEYHAGSQFTVPARQCLSHRRWQARHSSQKRKTNDERRATRRGLVLYHFDLYRLKTIEEMYDLGYEEYFFGEGVVAIEWGEKVTPLLPQSYLEMALKLGSKSNIREIEVIPRGFRGRNLAERWLTDLRI